MTGNYQPEPARRPAPPAARAANVTKHDRERFIARLLAKLPAPDEEAVSTTELGDYFQLDPYQRSNLLWTALDRLAKQGAVERIAVPGETARYWRHTPTGEQRLQDSDQTSSPAPAGDAAGITWPGRRRSTR